MDRKPNIIVRTATPKDIQYIVKVLAKKMLYFEYERPELYNEQCIQEIANKSQEQGCLLVMEDRGELVGVLGGVLHKHPFNTTIEVLSEVMWYVEEGYRKNKGVVRLLREYVNLEKGDEKTFSLLPNSPVSDRTMARYGFVKKEKGYIRR